MDNIDMKGRKFGLSGGHGVHAHLRQVEYFKDLYTRSGDTIVIDKKLEEILSL